MRMTHELSGSAATGRWVVPADRVGDEDVDVLSLAGLPVPAGGAWLWVTAAEARRGGELTALALPASRPVACGGDVLVQAAPRPGEEDGLTMRVWAVVAGSLVRVAAWDPACLACWPEVIRDPVVFAIGAMEELERHGADVGPRRQVGVLAAAASLPTAFPSLAVQGSPAG
jgi:hypothetical protein